MSATLRQNIQQVQARINAAEKHSSRIEGIVQLLAVSKTRSANEIRNAFAEGLTNFGENYLQEALEKQQQLTDLAICWHFIGPIQSNKTAAIAQHFDWVHSVDRIKIGRRLSEQRPAELEPLNICLQINISGEASKSGIAITDAAKLARQLIELPNIRLRGLMAIPSPTADNSKLENEFAQMKTLFEQLKAQGLNLDTLSMGMSNDLECAIAAGATIVRVGTALFGPRE